MILIIQFVSYLYIFKFYIYNFNTTLQKAVCPFILSEAVSVMDMYCLSLLVSILQAGSAYVGGMRRQTMKLGRCLVATFCLLAVTVLTLK